MAVLVLIEICILMIGIVLFKGDFFNPAVISTLVFIVATVLCSFYAELWNIHIVSKTIIVIAGSLFVMIGGTQFGRLLTTGHSAIQSVIRRRIIMPSNILVVLSILVVGMTLLYGISAYKLGLSYGGQGLNSFGYLKDAYGSGNATVRMNVLVRQGFKIVMACSYVACLLLSDQLVQGLRNKQTFFYVGWILCGVLITIMSGSRTDIVRLFSAFVLDYTILAHSINRTGNKSNTKRIKSVFRFIVPLLLIIIVISFSVKQVVKTTDVELSQSNSVIYYLAYYVGSPIAVLNTKIKLAFLSGSVLFPSSTDVPVFVYLGKLNYGGNVATLLGPTLFENGMIALWMKLLFMYGIGGYLYFKLNKPVYSTKYQYSLLLLLSLLYEIFTMSYYSDTWFMLSDIFTNGLIILLTLLIFWMFTKTVKVEETKDEI